MAYSPALKYDTTSATGNLTRAYSVKAYGLGLEYERWVKRHWGFDVRYKPMLYELFPAGVLSAASYSARAAYREHLTEQAYGFAFVAKVYAGLFAQEFRQIDRDVRPIKTSLPTGIGPQIGAEITWKISPKASLDAFASL